GVTESFENWAGPQDGWSVSDDQGSGVTWGFDDKDGLGNDTGSSGGFAAVEAFTDINKAMDTSLTSPVVDLSGVAAPEIDVNTNDAGQTAQPAHPPATAAVPNDDGGAVGSVELSLDGGKTWSTVWQQTDVADVSGRVDVPIPQAAGAADAR